MRWSAALAVVMVTVSACGSGQETPGPSVPVLTEMSFAPVDGTSTPEEVPSTGALPSVAPPSGLASAPAPAEADYASGADDFAGFVDAYRAALGGLDVGEADADVAGARLCTYLDRHADGNGVVVAQDALTEADLSEPGYAREHWVAVLGLAAQHYCTEFSVDFTMIGG